MLQVLLDSAVGPRLAGGSAGGALAHLLRLVLQQPCRTVSSLPSSSGQVADEDVSDAMRPSCSTSSCGQDRNPASGGSGTGVQWSGFRHHLPLLLQHQHQQGQQQEQRPQRRSISTTSSAQYKFDSHLTRYNKSKVVNRDNFQRFRDSGRDARVAEDILREGERQERRGGSRRGGRGDPADAALLELRSMVHDCRDLRAMQVLVRECVYDMSAFLICNVLGRLPQLKQDTPAAAAPDALAKRVADALMARLQHLADTSTPSSLGHALLGLANVGIMPTEPLLEALASRLTAAALSEADAKTVSKLLFATAKLLDARRHQLPLQQGAVAAEDDVLGKSLWPALRDAAEVKLQRALGQEPPSGGGGGGAAAARGQRSGDVQAAEEQDDSMPQSALRYMCIALTLGRETHFGIWTAAAHLAARHAAELQPMTAAGVLRSYAIAGGPALDGGRAKLLGCVWAALGPQVDGLEVEAQLDLLIATLKLAAGRAAGADEARIAVEVVPVLCRLLAARVPALSASDATHLAVALAELHSKAVAEAAAAPPPVEATPASTGGGGDPSGAAAPAASWRVHAYGVLPRLLADLLVLRGIQGFGASKFASVALALGLMGHADGVFWQQVAAVALPEVPRLDGTSLSRLLGAFYTAALAAEATGAAAPAPPSELLAAAHARAGALLQGGAGSLSGKALFHTVRALAEWPPQEGDTAAATAALAVLADRLAADKVAAAEVATAPAGVRERLATALRRSGLGEHALVGLLAGDGSGRP